MTTLLILTPVAIITSWIAAVIGMGGGITLLSVMTFFLAWEVLIPVHGIVQLTSNTSRALFLWKNIHWPFFFPFLIGAPFGGYLGYFVIQDLPWKELPLLLVASVIGYSLFKPKKLPHIILPKWAFAGLGILACFLSPLVGATGPLLAPFFFRDDLSKENIIATKAFCQTATHIIKIPVFLGLGFDYLQHWELIAALCLAAIIGTKLGVGTLKGMSENLFRWLYQIALFAAMLRLLWKVLQSGGYL